MKRLAAALALVLCGMLVPSSGLTPRLRASTAAVSPPNIVFVLTDDLAWNLITPQYMPHVIQLMHEGTTFDHYIVTDSLCCPSRSSIFTGLFPHDTGVFKNTGSDGGYAAFLKAGLEGQTYAAAIQPHGYLTAMMGKYLNGYCGEDRAGYLELGCEKPIPQGWGEWDVAASGYAEFDYQLNENGAVASFPAPPPVSQEADYMTDVLNGRATAFVNGAARAHKPFIMEVATFAPHAPYIPALRNANDFPGLKAPRTPAFNAPSINPPSWLAGVQHSPLDSEDINLIDKGYRMRTQSVEAVDKLIGDLEAALQANGQAGNTYIIFSSDNGYHMGEYRLMPGKQTAFDTDINVPLIVAGPGVPANRTVHQVVENIDLYPTFLQLAGETSSTTSNGCSSFTLPPTLKTPDGCSLVPLLHPVPRLSPLLWRTAALIEHHGPDTNPADPDFEYGDRGGNPTTYEAIRLRTRLATDGYNDAVYVEYNDGEREYYNISSDPHELDNTYSMLTQPRRTQLHNIVQALASCHGFSSCWTAAQPVPAGP